LFSLRKNADCFTRSFVTEAAPSDFVRREPIAASEEAAISSKPLRCRADLAVTSHSHLQSRSRVSHASVARGSVMASSHYTAVYATEQLRFGRIDLCRMSTRRTVTSTTSTRIVERSQVTAADGLHQHRRRAVGLVSDSRFVAVVSALTPPSRKKTKQPRSPQGIPRGAQGARSLPHHATKSGMVAAHGSGAPGLKPVPTSEIGRSHSKSLALVLTNQGIAPPIRPVPLPLCSD
jgi:hypothetical protein